jgi:heptosyltransferase-1
LRAAWQQKQLQTFYKTLRETPYDKIIDAQGLFKSAVVTRLAKGMRCGLDYYSAREALASCFYQSRYFVAPAQHAITRTRELFAWSLGYAVPTQNPDYAIRKHFALENHVTKKSVIFVHGTTWTTKEWPEDYWIALAKRCVADGWAVQIPWGNTAEKLRAERIASHDAHIQVLPRSTLTELATLLLQASAVIAVDTGIGHLAAALSVPTISLYGPTDPVKIGALGDNQHHLRKTNQMADISVDMVWEKLAAITS